MPEGHLRPVLAFAAFGHAWFHILVALFLTLVLVLEPVWQHPYDDLIDLWTVGAFLLGLGAPAAGWLSDRWGEARMMVVYFLGIGLATILCGLSDSPGQLGGALALMGLFGAIYHPVGTAWVTKHARQRGRALALLGLSGSLGAAAASLVAAGLSLAFGWRLAFLLPGAASVVAGLALAALIAGGRIADTAVDAATAREPDRRAQRRAFAVLAVTMSMTSVVYVAFTTMLPKWFERELGAGLDTVLGAGLSGEGLLGVGALVTLVYLLGATAQLFGGFLADRGIARQVYVASYGFKCAALLCAAALGSWPVVIAAAVILFAFDIAAPVESVLIARFTASRRRGLAYGLRNGIAIAAGPLGVQLVGWTFDEAAGFETLLLVLAGIAAAVLLCAGLVPRDGTQHETPEERARTV